MLTMKNSAMISGSTWLFSMAHINDARFEDPVVKLHGVNAKFRVIVNYYMRYVMPRLPPLEWVNDIKSASLSSGKLSHDYCQYSDITFSETAETPSYLNTLHYPTLLLFIYPSFNVIMKIPVLQKYIIYNCVILNSFHCKWSILSWHFSYAFTKWNFSLINKKHLQFIFFLYFNRFRHFHTRWHL